MKQDSMGKMVMLSDDYRSPLFRECLRLSQPFVAGHLGVDGKVTALLEAAERLYRGLKDKERRADKYAADLACEEARMAARMAAAKLDSPVRE